MRAASRRQEDQIHGASIVSTFFLNKASAIGYLTFQTTMSPFNCCIYEDCKVSGICQRQININIIHGKGHTSINSKRNVFVLSRLRYALRAF